MESEYQDIIDKLKVLKHVTPDEHFKRTLHYALSRELQKKKRAVWTSPFIRFGLALIVITMISGSGAVVASQHSKPGDILYPLKKTTDHLNATIEQQIVSKKTIQPTIDPHFENNGNDDIVIGDLPSPTPTITQNPSLPTPTTTITHSSKPVIVISPEVEITATAKKKIITGSSNASIKIIPSPTIPQLLKSDIVPTVLPNEVKETVKKILPLQKNK